MIKFLKALNNKLEEFCKEQTESDEMWTIKRLKNEILEAKKQLEKNKNRIDYQQSRFNTRQIKIDKAFTHLNDYLCGDCQDDDLVVLAYETLAKITSVEF